MPPLRVFWEWLGLVNEGSPAQHVPIQPIVPGGQTAAPVAPGLPQPVTPATVMKHQYQRSYYMSDAFLGCFTFVLTHLSPEKPIEDELLPFRNIPRYACLQTFAMEPECPIYN